MVALGTVTLDLISELAHHPLPDSTNRVLGRSSSMGGQAGRGALAAARLGAGTEVLSMIGTDPFAALLRQHADAEGLGVRWFEGEGPSQASSILVVREGGTRTTISNTAPPASPELLAAAAEASRSAPVVLLDCSEAALVRAVQAHRRGPTVVDTGSLKEASLPFLRGLSHLVVPRNFLDSWVAREDPGLATAPLEHQVAAAAAYFGSAVFLVTEGEAGGLAWQAGDTWRWAAHPVEVVDSNGAGDVFHGALAWALARGIDLAEGIDIAAWAAARKVAGPTNTTIPDAAELQRRRPASRSKRDGTLGVHNGTQPSSSRVR